MVYIIVGIFLVVLGTWAGICSDYFRHVLCGVCLPSIGALITLSGIFDTTNPTTTYYLEAEPLAYNSTQTVFTTDKGNIIVNGVYPDGVYMLDMNGDTVLVVWQAVDGEEVGLG